SRTCTIPILSRAPLPIGLRTQNWCQGRDSNSQTLVSKTRGYTDSPTLALVGRDGVEPPSSPETGIHVYSVLPLPLGQRPTKSNMSKIWRRVSDSNACVPTGRTCLANRLGCLLPILSRG